MELLEPDDGIKIYSKEQLDMNNDEMAKRPKAKKQKKGKNDNEKNTKHLHIFEL